MIVVFEVIEQRTVTKIEFRGNAHVDVETIKGLLDLKTGESIDPFRISVAKQAIRTLYRERNYPFTQVDVDQS